jgi:ribosomal protein L11 methyltransferase
MREVVLAVPRLAVEDVLDRLLPLVPGGVREEIRGRHVELRMRGPDVPATDELKRVVGRWPHRVSERGVSDDWRERRRDDYRESVIGDRVVVRPDWAPAALAGLTEIVLSEGAAFGAGTHPTTQTCLELLVELAPRGSFADLGCGTGVLAILASKLGWDPVQAVDVQPGSVEVAERNITANRAGVSARVQDLIEQPAPSVDGFAANVPATVQAAIAASWRDSPPEIGILSGFGVEEASAVLDAYASIGLSESRRLERNGWVIALVRRD